MKKTIPSNDWDIPEKLEGDGGVTAPMITFDGYVAIRKSLTGQRWMDHKSIGHDLQEVWASARHANNQSPRWARDNPVHEVVPVRIQAVISPVIEKEAMDPWRSHPDYPREDWQDEVSSGDTNLGYHDWVSHKTEEAGFDALAEQSGQEISAPVSSLEKKEGSIVASSSNHRRIVRDFSPGM